MNRNLLKALSFLLSLALCLSLASGIGGASAATNLTQQQAIDWVNAQHGVSIDDDGAYGAQCVDLIFAYYRQLVGYRVAGNGKDFATNALPSGWARYAFNDVARSLQPGDILVDVDGGGGYGHVGIYIRWDAATDKLIRAEQNSSATCSHCGAVEPSRVHIYSHTKTWEYVIRPAWKTETPVPTPTPTPTPTPEVPGEYSVWSDWSTTPVTASETRVVETRTVVTGYNMVVYVTQEAASPYHRNFRSYSVNGNYSAYGLRSSYGEHRYTRYGSKAEIDAAARFDEGVYISQDASHVGGYQRGSGQSYYFPDGYGWFIESEISETQYRYRTKTVLSSIAIASSPSKRSYIVGDTLDTTGLALIAVYSDASAKTISSGFSCSPTVLNTEGTQLITVTYGGKSVTFNVTVEKDEPVTENPYKDVSESDWFYVPVLYAYEKGLMIGMDTGIFAPYETLTRAQAALLIARLVGDDYLNYAGLQAFDDVPSDHWSAGAVAWAKANGVINGVGNNKFDPNSLVTEDQIEVMLMRNYRLLEKWNGNSYACTRASAADILMKYHSQYE